jgi:hypothetical protein
VVPVCNGTFGLQIIEVASTSSYQLQLQQLQAEEATAAAKAAAGATQAELQAALDSLQQASPVLQH